MTYKYFIRVKIGVDTYCFIIYFYIIYVKFFYLEHT